MGESSEQPDRSDDASSLGRQYHTVILAVCALVIIAAMVMSVEDDKVMLFGFASPMRCFMNHVLGVRCAFCGMTRSFIMTAHGQPVAAMGQHLFGPALFLYICLQIPYRVVALLAGGAAPLRLGRIGLVAGALIIGAILGHWLLYIGGLLI